MILVMHIGVALLSIIYVAYIFVAPTKTKLRVSYAMVASTLASGTYLVVSSGSSILKSCISGLIYLAVMFVGMCAANYKLSRITSREK